MKDDVRSSQCNQTRRLVTAQHHRQRACYSHRVHLTHQLGMIERDLEEELEPGDRRIQRDRRDAEAGQKRTFK